MSDQTVCIAAGSSPDVYHDVGEDGRPACATGRRSDGEFKTRHRSQLLSSVSYCHLCAGDEVDRRNVGRARETELAALSPEDLGLSPMGDRS